MATGNIIGKVIVIIEMESRSVPSTKNARKKTRGSIGTIHGKIYQDLRQDEAE